MHQMLLWSSSSEGKTMQISQCSTSTQRLAHLTFNLLNQQAHYDLPLTLSQLKPEDLFPSCIPNIASTEMMEEQQPQLHLHCCKDSARPYAQLCQAHGSFMPGFPLAKLNLIFMKDAQEQSIFQEDLISSGSKHHVIITQLQLRYEKQL